MGSVRNITTVVIGAGHAGLAMSRCLTERSIDHVVIERGEVANSWRTERWDSLRLLTPNWQSRLPGFGYEGDDPDGYRTMPEVIDFLVPLRGGDLGTGRDPYQRDIGIRCGRRLRCGHRQGQLALPGPCAGDRRLQRRADPCGRRGGSIRDRNLELDGLPQLSVSLTSGGVLIVGASATGTQLADEIHRSGRPVTLAVGEHVRAPRVYRGKDIQWWMDVAGIHDERYDEVDDIVRARRVPSLQLAGSPERRTLDLNALTEIGVKLVGRIAGLADGKVQFSGSLHNNCALADLKMNRLLNTIDDWATENGLDGEVDAPHRLARHASGKRTAAQPRSCIRQDTDDRLGDRLSP